MKRSRAQVQKKRSRKIAPTTIFSIPIYILMEILSKLPIFTICNCRIGCRSKVEAEINTLGTKLWRRLGEAPCNLRWDSSGCFLNGALHWIALDTEDYFESICCFDFGKELFQPFPVPSEFRGLPGQISVEVVNLGVLKDDLSLCHRPSNCTLHIWVMKDYAVQESWAKVFVINPSVAPDVNHDYEPLMVLKNGDILMLYASSFMVSFNTRNRSYRKVRVNGIREVIRALKYIPSFVSIKNAATGSNP